MEILRWALWKFKIRILSLTSSTTFFADVRREKLPMYACVFFITKQLVKSLALVLLFSFVHYKWNVSFLIFLSIYLFLELIPGIDLGVKIWNWEQNSRDAEFLRITSLV